MIREKRSKMLAEKKISADILSDLAKKGLQVDIVVHPEFSAYPEAGYPDTVMALMQHRSHILAIHPKPDQDALTEFSRGEAGKCRNDVFAEFGMHIVEGHFKMAPVAFPALPVKIIKDFPDDRLSFRLTIDQDFELFQISDDLKVELVVPGQQHGFLGQFEIFVSQFLPVHLYVMNGGMCACG